MKLAVIIVGAYSSLQNLHKFLPEFRLVKIDQKIEHGKVVIHLDPKDHNKTLQYVSLLKFNNYTTRCVIVQDSDVVGNYQSIISQLKCHEIDNITIGLDNDDIIKSIMSQITRTDIKCDRTPKKDKNDFSKLRHGRTRHKGTIVSRYLQSPPMLFSRDGHSMWLGDMYRGGSAFLILGGPSFASIDKADLRRPGVLTMGVNNSVKSFRPNLWISVDDPSHFMKSTWFDPTITKFVPFSHTDKVVFDNETWKETDIKVGDCPNVWYYRRNEHFIADQYLLEDTFNWGNHKDFGGGRSIMLAAVRMLYHLGVRTIYLLGCDFKMDKDTKYHFEQDRSDSSIKGNMSTYKQLSERFKQLKSIFDDEGLSVYNCNKDSGLKVFPFIDIKEAINNATKLMPVDIANERTTGLYDRQANIKKASEALVKAKKAENEHK